MRSWCSCAALHADTHFLLALTIFHFSRVEKSGTHFHAGQQNTILTWPGIITSLRGLTYDTRTPASPDRALMRDTTPQLHISKSFICIHYRLLHDVKAAKRA